MRIKVLGPGCAKCHALEKNVRQAVESAGITAEIIKVSDLNEIVAHDVIITPALVVDDRVLSVGKLLTVDEIRKLLTS